MSQQQILYIAVLVFLISYQNKSNQYFMSVYVFIFHLCQYYTINPSSMLTLQHALDCQNRAIKMQQ